MQYRARMAVIEVLPQVLRVVSFEFANLAGSSTADPARFSSLGNLVLGASRSLGLKRIAQGRWVDLRTYLASRAGKQAHTVREARFSGGPHRATARR